jgi:hypothetical protein
VDSLAVPEPSRPSVSEWRLPARLHGRLLHLVRAAWLVIAVALVGAVTAGLVRAYGDPRLIELAPLTQLFEALGLNMRLMMGIALVAPFVVVVVVCAFVFRHRSADPMALLFTMMLLCLYSFSSRSLLGFADVPVIRHAPSVVFWLLGVSLTLVLALFPDGRFVPRSAMWLAPPMALVLVAFPDAPMLMESLVGGEASARARTAFAAVIPLILVGVAAQAYRYRNVSGREERQQAKWVIAPLGLWLVLVSLTGTLPLVVGAPEPWIGWIIFLAIPLGTVAPVMVANAVLRYRLYAIDRIISRTLSYAIVVGVLGAAYAASVIGLGTSVSALTAKQDTQLAVAVSVLAMVALFRPLQTRVHRIVDRRFNRTGYEAEVAVRTFAQNLRDQVDLETIRRQLEQAARTIVEPSCLSVWLPDDRMRGPGYVPTTRAPTLEGAGARRE